MEVDEDPVKAIDCGREAVKVGRQIKSIELELLGLALEGLALVSEANVDEGMRRLDETSAAASSGEIEGVYSTVWIFCYLMYACERVRDFDRTAQWCDIMDEFSQRRQLHFLNGVCRARYANILVLRGKWSEAEVEAEA